MNRSRNPIAWLTCGMLLAIMCGSVGMLVFAVNRSRASAQQPPKNSIVYGLTLQPSGIDPHINASSELGIALRSVYDTLVYRDPKTRAFVPGLALQTDVSADGKEYTFKLRQDVRFHDGSPFNAQAVARTLDRVTSSDTKSQKALFLLGPFDRYEIVDQFTIKIVLKEPYAALLDGFAQVYLGIASPTALTTYPNDQYQFHQVGTGPFKFVEYIPGDHLTIRRNPDYKWGPSFYTPPTDKSVDEIVFRFYTDPATRATALEAGDAIVMGELSPLDARSFNNNGDLRLIPQAVPGLPTQWFMNAGRAPTSSTEFRQALILATNRPAIVDAIFQEYSPVAFGPLNASTPFYATTVQSMYAFDSAKAIAQFKRAGYDFDAASKTLRKGADPVRLVMIVPRWGFHSEIAQKLQSQWREVGIDLEMRVVPNLAGLLAEQKKGEYNLIAYNDSGADASLLTRFYRSDAVPNWTGYKNADLDTWLNEAGRTLDANRRAELYGFVQKRIMDQALILPIRDTVNLNGAKASVGNLAFDAYGWFPLLANVTIESK